MRKLYFLTGLELLQTVMCIPQKLIMEFSGHKSTVGVMSYEHATMALVCSSLVSFGLKPLPADLGVLPIEFEACALHLATPKDTIVKKEVALSVKGEVADFDEKYAV